MAVNVMNEYAAQRQAAEAAKTQQSNASAGTNRGKEAGRKEGRDNTKPPSQDEAVSYEVPKRANEVAAWYQEFLIKEQEEKLGMAAEETEEKKKEEEEEDPIKKKLEEAEKIIKSLQLMLDRMREAQKRQREEKKKNKGKLSYNYRRVSTAISSAKTASQASNALSSATANLSALRRKAASGKYEDREIQVALQHAYKMIRTARKKVNNLKSESMQKKKHDMAETQAKQQVKAVHHAPKRRKAQIEMDRLQKELKARERQKKARNRRGEDMELLEADMQYLKRKLGLMQQGYMNSNDEKSPEEMIEAALGLIDVEMAEDAMKAQEGSEGQAAESAPAESAPVDAGYVPVSGGFDASV